MNDYTSLFAIMGAFIFVFVIIGIILYVLMALGMQAMAKKLEIENPWLAWIPIVNVYLLGKIAGDQIKIFNAKIDKLSLVLLIGGICLCVIYFIPFINALAFIAYAVIYYVTLYKVYRIFAEDSATLYCVFSILIDITVTFFIYFASKNEPNLAIFNEGKTIDFNPATETPSFEKVEEY